MTVAERRRVVAGLRKGDRVAIGREQDTTVTAVGVVLARTSSVVRVGVGASRIPFHPTGLERASAASSGVGLGRGLRVIVAKVP